MLSQRKCFFLSLWKYLSTASVAHFYSTQQHNNTTKLRHIHIHTHTHRAHGRACSSAVFFSISLLFSSVRACKYLKTASVAQFWLKCSVLRCTCDMPMLDALWCVCVCVCVCFVCVRGTRKCQKSSRQARHKNDAKSTKTKHTHTHTHTPVRQQKTTPKHVSKNSCEFSQNFSRKFFLCRIFSISLMRRVVCLCVCVCVCVCVRGNRWMRDKRVCV